MINIKWFGHSMWKIWNDQISLITDPFTAIGYKLPSHETADIVLSSHDHFDHNNFSLIKGDPAIFNQPGIYQHKGIKITNFPVWHDDTEGSQRGANLLMKFSLAGKNFLHCGDLGHIPEQEVITKLGNIDILFVPIGGFYTIDADQAKQLIDLLSPVITFPMHYKTAVLDFPIASAEPFQKLFPNFRKIENNTFTLQATDFTAAQVIFLNYV